MRKTLIALCLSVLPLAAFAQNASPVGTWTTIDDSTHKPKSHVEIYATANGTLAAKVLEVLQSEQGPHPVCDACSGERKGKPVEGMVIMWNVRKDGDTWDGGKILDPHNGKTYSVKLTPSADGSKMEVRGYMGFSLLGRSQTWIRKH